MNTLGGVKQLGVVLFPKNVFLWPRQGLNSQPSENVAYNFPYDHCTLSSIIELAQFPVTAWGSAKRASACTSAIPLPLSG